jgi:hypothetical protein
MVFVTVDRDSYIQEGMLERYSGSALGQGWIYDRIVLCPCCMFLKCCNGEGLDGWTDGRIQHLNPDSIQDLTVPVGFSQVHPRFERVLGR